MSDNKLIENALEQGQEYYRNFSADKLRNNFYGYLVVSFLIFNFENIILIFKSKDMIEMTLIYIQAQQEFAWNFFWKPLWYGIGAALVMPVITAGYVMFSSVFDAIRTQSKGFGTTLWERFKLYNEKRLKNAETDLEELESTIRIKKYELDQVASKIFWSEERKESLEMYLVNLAKIYGKYNKNNQHRDIAGLLNEIDKSGLSKHFPNEQELNEVISFFKRNDPEPVPEPENSQN